MVALGALGTFLLFVVVPAVVLASPSSRSAAPAEARTSMLPLSDSNGVQRRGHLAFDRVPSEQGRCQRRERRLSPIGPKGRGPGKMGGCGGARERGGGGTRERGSGRILTGAPASDPGGCQRPLRGGVLIGMHRFTA